MNLQCLERTVKQANIYSNHIHATVFKIRVNPHHESRLAVFLAHCVQPCYADLPLTTTWSPHNSTECLLWSDCYGCITKDATYWNNLFVCADTCNHNEIQINVLTSRMQTILTAGCMHAECQLVVLSLLIRFMILDYVQTLLHLVLAGRFSKCY